MNRLNVIKLVITVLVIIAAGVLAFLPLSHYLKLGIDLQGV